MLFVFSQVAPCSDADCIVEAILLLMLSLVDSGSSRCRDRAASTLDTIASVGNRFGVTECFSPYDSPRVSFLSKGREEMFLTQLSSGLLRLCWMKIKSYKKMASSMKNSVCFPKGIEFYI